MLSGCCGILAVNFSLPFDKDFVAETIMQQK